MPQFMHAIRQLFGIQYVSLLLAAAVSCGSSCPSVTEAQPSTIGGREDPRPKESVWGSKTSDGGRGTVAPRWPSVASDRSDALLVAGYAPQAEGDDDANSNLPPFPALTFDPKGKRDRQAVIDQQALDAWCKAAGLPAPPQVAGLDAATWALVHPAIEAAGRNPTVATLSALAKYYDGHRGTKQAVVLYQRLTKLEPRNHEWWHLLGINELSNGHGAASIAALTRALQLAPKHTATQARLAEAYLLAGDNEKAIKTWQSYLSQRQSVVGFTGLAQAYEANQDYERALRAAEVAISADAEARPALVIAARLAARLGDNDKGTEYSQRANELTSADDPVLFDEIETQMYAFAKPVEYLRKAILHYKETGDYHQAYEAAKLLAERRPDEFDSWQLLLWLATATRDTSAPLEDYAKNIIELKEDFGPAWEVLAREDLAKGNHRAAAQKAIKSLRLQPDLTKAYLTLGLALGKLDRNEDAVKALDVFLKANPRHMLALQMKTACLFNLKRRDETEATAREMLKIDPNNEWAQAILQKVKNQS